MKPINQNLSINLDLIKNSELLYFFKPYMWKKTSYHFFCEESIAEHTVNRLEIINNHTETDAGVDDIEQNIEEKSSNLSPQPLDEVLNSYKNIVKKYK
ncbi:MULTISPECIES: hypothetical protein [unclassified Acinetobacter]|uniref:hypothetical protein n=1 Tax=unclassified Acinetobacter TaxID=196816 RepID=UPI002934A067|nr:MULTISPECIES: hypothetical protein [unclassified Acinetobacter]WOE33316.1 hypothetical protein QSG84_15580 [Acinetobacter sp. SAAs470]WOE37025.1 hypothetical protein QSG86_00580 [Acinetobacter sp. SAAs474]